MYAEHWVCEKNVVSTEMASPSGSGDEKYNNMSPALPKDYNVINNMRLFQG